jgi:hypothetical protein
MSLESWGILILTTDRKAEAREAIRQCNVALSRMPLTHEERMAIDFNLKHIVTRKPITTHTYYVYAQNLPSRFRPNIMEIR